MLEECRLVVRTVVLPEIENSIFGQTLYGSLDGRNRVFWKVRLKNLTPVDLEDF